jgi:hydroxypyruvate reductase
VPDENGLIAAKAVKELVESAGQDDFVLFLISGGGSALLPLPAHGLSLEDKMAVNSKLLASGADITQMNLVRQALSALKGGRLAAIAKPARMRSLILSDVIGDDLRVIASGPTIAPIGTRQKAKEMLQDLGLFDELPQKVQDHLLLQNTEDEPNTSMEECDAALVGSNSRSVSAMHEHCEGNAKMIDKPLEGLVDEAAEEIVQKIQNAKPGEPLLFGGETTVLLSGDGLGGRNQELTLRVALLMEQSDYQGDWIFLSGGTDGRDGPTDAAGAIVDGGTLARIRAAGGDPQALLFNNDSYKALSLSNDLLIIGATGTNVADLQIFLCT